MEHTDPEIQTSLDSTDDNETVEGGTTDRKIFWGVFLASLIVLSIMVGAMSQGAIAMAAAVPVPMTVQAGTLKGTNFHLFPGLSQADNATPVAVNQMDATITNLTISKSLSVPVIGTITVTLTAGNKGTPVNITSLTTDISSLNTDSASFSNMAFSTAGTGLDQTAASATLNNATISSPFLMASNITLPGLSLSITHN
ncbi:MAG TPA: DUF6230 family protein [Ktedonosporobacter sp.]|jgi:uncharacterized membrane protein|nr:DUF6230 family protein [Ktedonosporobacter sp.]